MQARITRVWQRRVLQGVVPAFSSTVDDLLPAAVICRRVYTVRTRHRRRAGTPQQEDPVVVRPSQVRHHVVRQTAHRRRAVPHPTRRASTFYAIFRSALPVRAVPLSQMMNRGNEPMNQLFMQAQARPHFTPAEERVIQDLPVMQLDKVNCTICFEEEDEQTTPQTVKRLPCGHDYHAACIDRWLRVNNTCPLCKHRI